MDSPLDIIDGTFASAILTTFTIELDFIDHWVLPRLAQAGVRNVAIFCDSLQLADQLSYGVSPRAGQHYTLAPVPTRGSFHPKVIYLSGPAEQRACVSSGNLTAAGQLRNLETAGTLTSENPEHRSALTEIRDFLRRIAETQGAHVIEAVLEALEPSESETAADGLNVRFLHNLSLPILEQLPPGNITATAPFASADALNKLRRNRDRLVVQLDERRIDAIDQARAVDLELSVVRFADTDGHSEPRTVHGKAIWSDEGWCLVGSPNLTGPALLQSASAGNVEAALLFNRASTFVLPPHEAVPIPPEEPRRSAALRVPNSLRPQIFTAVFDAELVVDGLPDGIKVEYATPTGWESLGVVRSGIVHFDGSPPLIRLRARLYDGRLAYAVVHHVPYLRARRRAPSGRSARVVERLPLDLEGVRELEAVLGNLYALDDLAAEELDRYRSSAVATGTRAVGTEEMIDHWRPARPGGDPRIPDLYRRVFEGDQDALLALVRHALRLDRDENFGVSLEDNEEWTEETADAETNQSELNPPRTAAAVVRRYRTSLVALLDRGSQRIRTAKSGPLRDLIFLEVLRFHERLTEMMVRVPAEEAADLGALGPSDEEGMVELHLVQSGELAQSRLDLIDAYLSNTSAPDGICASALMVHLAAAVADRGLLGELGARRLDDICYRFADHLLRSADPTWAQPESMNAEWSARLLEPYAERTDWYAIVDHCEAEGWIRSGDLDLEPFPTVSGWAPFKVWMDSPAWKLIGYSCVAGYESQVPFLSVVHNDDEDAPFAMHCLLVEPTTETVRGDWIHEAILRRADGRWLCGSYERFHNESADRLFTVVGVQSTMGELRRPNREADSGPPLWLDGVRSVTDYISV